MAQPPTWRSWRRTSGEGVMAFPDPEAEARFHEMIGRCIAAWAKVDDELFQVFHACVGGHLKQCAIVYYQMPGLSIRRGATDELVKSILPTTLPGQAIHPSLRAWTRAVAGFGDLLGVRRRIAHHHAASRIEPGALDIFPPLGGMPFSGRHSKHWFEVAEGHHEASRGKNKPALRIDDLKSHVDAVNSLALALRGFCGDTLQMQLSGRAQQ